MNIVVIGRTEMLLEAAKRLHSNKHKIVAIITCKSETFYEAKENDYEKFAQENRTCATNLWEKLLEKTKLRTYYCN